MPCSLWNISFQHLLSITNKIEWRLSLFNLNIWAPTNNKSITLLIINHLLRKLAKRRFISSSLSGGHQLYKLAQFNWIQIFYGKQLHCARGLLFFFKCPFNSFVISINPRERTSDFSQSFSIRLARGEASAMLEPKPRYLAALKKTRSAPSSFDIILRAFFSYFPRFPSLLVLNFPFTCFSSVPLLPAKELE